MNSTFVLHMGVHVLCAPQEGLESRTPKRNSGFGPHMKLLILYAHKGAQ